MIWGFTRGHGVYLHIYMCVYLYIYAYVQICIYVPVRVYVLLLPGKREEWIVWARNGAQQKCVPQLLHDIASTAHQCADCGAMHVCFDMVKGVPTA